MRARCTAITFAAWLAGTVDVKLTVSQAVADDHVIALVAAAVLFGRCSADMAGGGFLDGHD